MRAVREYFGADQTTVTYEHEITGVGGNADEFFVLCEAGRQQGKPAVRTTIHFTHDEMANLLADYRQHHPIEGTAHQLQLPAPADRWRIRQMRRLLLKIVRFRKR
jgi:hypothetical protein